MDRFSSEEHKVACISCGTKYWWDEIGENNTCPKSILHSVCPNCEHCQDCDEDIFQIMFDMDEEKSDSGE